MNWKATYARLQIASTIAVAAVFGAGFWSFLIAGILNVTFEIGENESLLYFGAPLFLVFLVIFAKNLREPLRRAGLLSDPPESFESPRNRDNV
ncbi:hypothetical protein [Cupriavidus sp. 2SB]|uniref:hypothetical protein n=1 Tax=Cupriavidus sp. 2SB TaxID=2502199 RepID=UPI0010F7041E|nr:hypothetical protein [Cupriavidus sp. 2SB]